jgi:hypothetical protein
MTKIDRPQFDPNWQARHELALKRLDGLAPTASGLERQAALEALYQAYDAQFPTVAALAEFRFASLGRSALGEGFMLAMKPLDPQASEADLDEAWRAAGRQIEAAKRARARPPLAQPDGLAAFSATPPAGARRQVLRFEAPTPSGGRQTWAAVVERAGRKRLGREIDVCIVQLEPGCGVYSDFAGLATRAAHHLFPAPWWRAWAWRPSRRLQFYSYVPWGLHSAGSESFCARALDWSKGRFVEDWDRRRPFACVPPLLAGLDPKPMGPHLLMPFDGSGP